MPGQLGGFTHSGGQHVRVDVDTNNRNPALGEFARHAPGAATGIEHRARRESHHERDLAMGVATGGCDLFPPVVVGIAAWCCGLRPPRVRQGRGRIISGHCRKCTDHPLPAWGHIVRAMFAKRV